MYGYKWNGGYIETDQAEMSRNVLFPYNVYIYTVSPAAGTSYASITVHVLYARTKSSNLQSGRATVSAVPGT